MDGDIDMSMTRKHFQAIAKVMQANRPPDEVEWRYWEQAVNELAGEFKRFNTHFDTERFKEACRK